MIRNFGTYSSKLSKPSTPSIPSPLNLGRWSMELDDSTCSPALRTARVAKVTRKASFGSLYNHSHQTSWFGSSPTTVKFYGVEIFCQIVFFKLHTSQFPDLNKASFFTLTTYFRHSLTQSFSFSLLLDPSLFISLAKGERWCQHRLMTTSLSGFHCLSSMRKTRTKHSYYFLLVNPCSCWFVFDTQSRSESPRHSVCFKHTQREKNICRHHKYLCKENRVPGDEHWDLARDLYKILKSDPLRSLCKNYNYLQDSSEGEHGILVRSLTFGLSLVWRVFPNVCFRITTLG